MSKDITHRIALLDAEEKRLFDTYKSKWGDDTKKAEHLETMAKVIRERIKLQSLVPQNTAKKVRK